MGTASGHPSGTGGGSTEPPVPRGGFDWQAAEVIARRSGHVLCQCPACGTKQFVSYRPPSQAWPICHVCVPEHLTRPSGRYPRVIPIGDVSLVRKNPGKPRSRKQLIEDGLTERPKPGTVVP